MDKLPDRITAETDDLRQTPAVGRLGEQWETWRDDVVCVSSEMEDMLRGKGCNHRQCIHIATLAHPNKIDYHCIYKLGPMVNLT